MTGQPAVQLRAQFPVTTDTESHLKFDRPETVHAFYVPVTFGAVESRPFDVGNVVEKDKIGNPIDAHPGNGFLRFVTFLFPDDLGMPGDDIVMAEETFFHRRNSGVRRPFHKGMAKPAVDLLDSGMDPVTEINRLLRAQVAIGINIIKIEHNRQENTHCPDPKVSPNRFCRRSF